jgi:hypothetical protein
MRWSKQLGLTFLTRGTDYEAPKAELKAARNLMRRAGIPPADMSRPGYPKVDTIVIELVAKLEQQLAYAIRYFGFHSVHNRWEDDTNAHVCLIKCIIRGLDQLSFKIKTEFKWVKHIIFQTESEDLMAAIQNTWTWARDGFPDVLPDGASPKLYLLLNEYLETMEAIGVSVKFWKLPVHFLPGASNQAAGDLHKEVGRQYIGNEGACGLCTTKMQIRELDFALNGEPDTETNKKYGNLKKGDTFLLYNNAGVDVKVTMQFDGSVAVAKEKALNAKWAELKAKFPEVMAHEHCSHSPACIGGV